MFLPFLVSNCNYQVHTDQFLRVKAESEEQRSCKKVHSYIRTVKLILAFYLMSVTMKENIAACEPFWHVFFSRVHVPFCCI